jgi:hypothetical protein
LPAVGEQPHEHWSDQQHVDFGRVGGRVEFAPVDGPPHDLVDARQLTDVECPGEPADQFGIRAEIGDQPGQGAAGRRQGVVGHDIPRHLGEVPDERTGVRPNRKVDIVAYDREDHLRFRTPPAVDRALADARAVCDLFDGQMGVADLVEQREHALPHEAVYARGPRTATVGPGKAHIDHPNGTDHCESPVSDKDRPAATGQARSSTVE